MNRHKWKRRSGLIAIKVNELVCVCEDELGLLIKEGGTMGKREKAGDRKDKHTERKIYKKTAAYLEKDAKKK